MLGLLLSLSALVWAADGMEADRAGLRSEKILLRIDSVIHAPIDTLVVSGSIWEASELRPSAYSRYVYVELINDKDSVVDRHKWVCGSEPGCFRGRIPLEADRLEGTWFIRAYTRLMRNFPETTFTILPFDRNGAVPLALEESNEEVTRVRWYPEGGHLVAGFPQALAFQALDKDGYPALAEAVLLNEGGDTLASALRTRTNGLGDFSFIPERGMAYYLGIGDTTYLCPQCEEKPVLQLWQHRGRVLYKVLLPGEADGKYEFVLFYRGRPCMSRVIGLGQTEGLIEASGLTSGIFAGILLEEGSRRPVSEHLLFYQGTMDSTVLGLDDEERAFLLLTSDMSSPVWNASYYLDQAEERRNTELNRLMLSMKWGRFAWEDALDPSFQYVFTPEEVLTLSGEVRTEMGRPLKEGRVVAINNTSGLTYDGGIVDGRFMLGVDDFADQTSFFLQAYDLKGKSYNFSVLLDPDIFPPVVNPLRDFRPCKSISTETRYAGNLVREYHLEEDGSKTYHVPEVTVSTRRSEKEPSTKDFYGVNFIGETVLDHPEFPDLIPYLDRMIGFEVTWENTDEGVRYALRPTRGVAVLSSKSGRSSNAGRTSGERDPNELVVLLDGRLVDTTWALQSIPSSDIASIERLTPAQTLQYVSHGLSGAILLKTKGYKKQTVSSKGIIYVPLGLSNLP